MELCEREDEPTLTSHWQTLIAGRSTTLSVRFRTRDQERQWVQIACVPVVDSALGVVSITGCVTAVDVQRKIEHETAMIHTEASERVALSESRLLNFVENAPVGILMFDQNRTPSFVNKAWFHMTGHSPVLAQSVKVNSIIYPEDISVFEARLDEVSRTGKPDSFQIRLKDLRRKTSGLSEHTWVQFTAFPETLDTVGAQLTTMITDISDLKAAEALQRAKLEEAIEAKRQQEQYVTLHPTFCWLPNMTQFCRHDQPRGIFSSPLVQQMFKSNSC